MHLKGPLNGNMVQLTNLKEEDLPELWEIIYEEEHPAWRKWDPPYLAIQPIKYEKYHDQMLNLMKQGLDNQLVITVTDEVIGVIYQEWEHESSNSLEIGLAIYRPSYLDGSYETDALKTYIDYLFHHSTIPRIGLTTWSGNERMIHIGKELGMIIEGRIRKSRLYRGKYYDSVKLGILREEWEAMQSD